LGITQKAVNVRKAPHEHCLSMSLLISRLSSVSLHPAI
jgi:hypothetical protein